MNTTVCFGEIMARFSPAGCLRLGQALPGNIEVTFAGAEANAAVAIARLGGRAEFVTALPANTIADAALAALRATGVGVGHVLLRAEGRLGLYFVETGSGPRGGLVVYDRAGSTFTLTVPDLYPWDAFLAGATWFHISGISAGVSKIGADASLAGIRAARQHGLTISCDLNFRRKLWSWDSMLSPEALAQRTLAGMIPETDVLIGNAHDIALSMGEGFTGDADDGLSAPTALARRAAARFPNLKWIAVTLRKNHSAERNRWGALLLRVADGTGFAAPLVNQDYSPYSIERIVDRVGTGDVFAGALIFALQTPGLSEPARAIHFATAASCLAHSTVGDFFQGNRAEVENFMAGDADGALSR